MMNQRATGLTAGEILALGDAHRRGLHPAGVADCLRCTVEGLNRSAGASVAAGVAEHPAVAQVQGESDGRYRTGSEG